MKAQLLDVASHLISFDQSECFILELSTHSGTLKIIYEIASR